MIEESRKLLADSSPISIPDTYAAVSHRAIHFSAHFYKHTLGEMRAVYIVGPKIEIINLFFFPTPTEMAPIYAMEFVQMGRRAVVGVIDVVSDPAQLTAVEEARSIIEPIRFNYKELKQGEDPPDWFQECRSGSDFFVRPEGAAQLTQLRAAHFQVFENYLDRLGNHAARADSSPSGGERSARNWQSNYKAHHAENSPGLPFLNRTFGEEWAQVFLNQYLFA